MVAHSFSTIISGAVRRSRSGGDLHAQTQRQPKQPGLIARSVEKTRSLFFATERAKVAPAAPADEDVGFFVHRRLPRPALDLDLDVFGSPLSSRPESASSYSQDSLAAPNKYTFYRDLLLPAHFAAPKRAVYPASHASAHHVELRAPTPVHLTVQPTFLQDEQLFRQSFLFISESDHVPTEPVQRTTSMPLTPPNKHLLPHASSIADKTKAALVRVKSSLRIKRSLRPTATRVAPIPRLTLYHGSDSQPASFTELLDMFVSQSGQSLPAPLGSQWLEPLDATPHTERLCHHPRPLSWPSILPRCPDPPSGTSESVLDFHVAADLMLNCDLPGLQRDDDDDTEDYSPLVTPQRDRPPTPFGLDFAMRSAWSDTESEFEADMSTCSALNDEAHKQTLALPAPLVAPQEDRSVLSLSLWPSPPGSPTLTERFHALPNGPSTPARMRRGAAPSPPSFFYTDLESPTLRTARIRRETMARLEGRRNRT